MAFSLDEMSSPSSEFAEIKLGLRQASGGWWPRKDYDKQGERDRKEGGVSEFGIIEFAVQPAQLWPGSSAAASLVVNPLRPGNSTIRPIFPFFPQETKKLEDLTRDGFHVLKVQTLSKLNVFTLRLLNLCPGNQVFVPLSFCHGFSQEIQQTLIIKGHPSIHHDYPKCWSGESLPPGNFSVCHSFDSRFPSIAFWTFVNAKLWGHL